MSDMKALLLMMPDLTLIASKNNLKISSVSWFEYKKSDWKSLPIRIKNHDSGEMKIISICSMSRVNTNDTHITTAIALQHIALCIIHQYKQKSHFPGIDVVEMGFAVLRGICLTGPTPVSCKELSVTYFHPRSVWTKACTLVASLLWKRSGRFK